MNFFFQCLIVWGLVAEWMMKRMGWSEGQGLGKREQGHSNNV